MVMKQQQDQKNFLGKNSVKIITKKEIKEIIMDLPSNSPEEDFQIVYEMGYRKYQQFLSEKIQVFRKNLTKTLTKLQVEKKELFKKLNLNIINNKVDSVRDRKRSSEINEDILIIKSKIGAINELEKSLGIEPQKGEK